MSSIFGNQRVKLGFAVVALIAAGVLIVPRLFSSGPIPNSYNFVCVSTGERFTVPTNELGGLPHLNKKTGERTLMPCYQDGDQLRVGDRYREVIDRLTEEHKNNYVDPETLIVKANP